MPLRIALLLLGGVEVFIELLERSDDRGDTLETAGGGVPVPARRLLSERIILKKYQ